MTPLPLCQAPDIWICKVDVDTPRTISCVGKMSHNPKLAHHVQTQLQYIQVKNEFAIYWS